MPKLRVKGVNVANYRLKVYAPGDGALAFSWVNTKNNNADGKLSVTREDVDAFIKKEIENYKKYKVAIINGELRLVHWVVRENSDTLKIDGTSFHYTLTAEGAEILRERSFYLNFFHVSFTFVDNGIVHELKNFSKISALIFFLIHEKELTS